MNRPPDIKAIITCNRDTPFYNGYRPAHLIKDDYLTSGEHKYYDIDKIECNESKLGYITFITPEAYPNCLWKGKRILIQEGSKTVGEAIITEIYNELLLYKDR